MKMNQSNEIVVDENDLVEGMLRGQKVKRVVTHDVEKIEQFNHFCTLFRFDDTIDYETPSDNIDKYSYANAENWYMPDEYKCMDIQKYLMDKCNTQQQRDRTLEEIMEYDKRNMMPLLKFMVYMVNELKNNNIIWGVGRGSSVSSYVLYLIGVHRIDSIKYDLDYKEFLR